MTYLHEHQFSTSRQLLEFFLWDGRFRVRSQFGVGQIGRNGIIFRGHSDDSWTATPQAFRQGCRWSDFGPQGPSDETPPADRRRPHLGWHLKAEARALYLFMESADAMGIRTPLDYTIAHEGVDLMQAAMDDDASFDFEVPFPENCFHRATALAQHYGVPTRFLDWSESPFVACYFAAINASSFATESVVPSSVQTPKTEKKMAVLFASSNRMRDADDPVVLINAPRHENANLKEQKGVFTNFTYANTHFLETGRWPSMELYAEQVRLERALLPISQADDLLRDLYHLGIARHTLMPNFETASKAYAYGAKLFQR